MMHLMSGTTGNTGTSAVITTTTDGLTRAGFWDYLCPQPGYNPGYYGDGLGYCLTYPFPIHLEQPMKPAEKYLVIAQSNGTIHSRHETVEDAEAAAARAAAKADEVYLVFRAVKQFQQKPVDVESKDL